jgi:hypothetical protein
MMARILAAIVALIAWIGLAVQFRASYAVFHTVPSTLWAMVLYFTVIVNLLVAVVFTAMALGRSRLASPFRLGGVTIAILLVGIVYNTLLRGLVELSGGAALADLINHSVTPVTVTLFWIFVADKGHLGSRAPLHWAMLPLVYFAYALVRASFEGKYPYPFIDVAQLGWGRTLLNAAAIALVFVVMGSAMVWLDRRLSSHRRLR